MGILQGVFRSRDKPQNSYTRAGSMIAVDDVNYLIESTDHSIKNGVHYVKLGLRRYG